MELKVRLVGSDHEITYDIEPEDGEGTVDWVRKKLARRRVRGSLFIQGRDRAGIIPLNQIRHIEVVQDR